MTSQRRHADGARPDARPAKRPRTEAPAGDRGRSGAAPADSRDTPRRSLHRGTVPASTRSAVKPASADAAGGRADGDLPTSPRDNSRRQACDNEVIASSGSIALPGALLSGAATLRSFAVALHPQHPADLRRRCPERPAHISPSPQRAMTAREPCVFSISSRHALRRPGRRIWSIPFLAPRCHPAPPVRHIPRSDGALKPIKPAVRPYWPPAGWRRRTVWPAYDGEEGR